MAEQNPNAVTEGTIWYLVLSRRVSDGAVDPRVHEAHVKWLVDQHRDGHVLVSGPSVDGTTGIYVLLASDQADAEALAGADPYVVHGLRASTVTAWNARRAMRLDGPSVTEIEAMVGAGR